jgi:hypothetical protein
MTCLFQTLTFRGVSPPRHAALFPLPSDRTVRQGFQRSLHLFRTRERLVQSEGDKPAGKIVPGFRMSSQRLNDDILNFGVRGAGRNAGTPAADRVVAAVHRICNSSHIAETDFKVRKFAMSEQTCPGLESCVRVC